MKSQKELVEKLKKEDVLKTKELIDAFLNVDRAYFVLNYLKDQAYLDEPLPLVEGQTISQPWTVAFMLELLELKKGLKCLDIGFGSGWTTMLIWWVTRGETFASEINSHVFDLGVKNITRFLYEKLNIKELPEEIHLFNNNGVSDLVSFSPFDRILVSAAAEKIPQILIDQLNDGGIMVIPVKNSLFKVLKNNGKIYKEEFPGFVFVPLIE
jgi:protein-L-isoaspartate(D-aspartate) O-methyltransferase